jgi:type IV pilus assembly protein PilE
MGMRHPQRSASTPPAHRNRGFTLIEVMVVVVIVAILASIAYPSYRDHVIRSQRSVAMGTLMDLAARQEQYFLDNRQYASSLTNLGYPADEVHLDSNRNTVEATSPRRIYEVNLQAATTDCPATSCFVLQAIPRGAQAADTRCATFTLASDGTRSATGTDAISCW